MSFFDSFTSKYINGGVDPDKYKNMLSDLEKHKRGVTCLGHVGPYGLFLGWLVSRVSDNGQLLKGIVIAHEVDWCNPECMKGYHQYSFSYQAAQEKLGRNLKYVGMERSELMRRTLIRFDFDEFTDSALLFTPATGEELCFEIYGVLDHHSTLIPLFTGEA